MSQIKDRLMIEIASADASLTPQTSHVFADFDIETSVIRNLPIVTVRINELVWDLTYGRKIAGGATGNIAVYSFSAHVFATNTVTTNEPRAKDVSILANKIIDQLEKRHNQLGAYGIFDIFDLSARESEPSDGAGKVSRIIIEGKIEVLRPD